MENEHAPRGIDPTKAHPARRYNYWLGGKDNFRADRESAEQVATGFSTVRLAAVENRKFLRRAVTHLTAEAGVRQFLDIGTGLPSAGNVHEVAQAIAPQSRIVYVDNDPIVLVHARALLTSVPEGATAYLDADVRNPRSIIEHPDLLRTLDMTRPIALMLVATMHFVTNDQDPYGIVTTLREILPSGSHLVMTHATDEHLDAAGRAEAHEANVRSGIPFQTRDRAEFARFFDGLELLPPGIVNVIDWRPDEPAEDRPDERDVSMWCGVARVP
ncbi:SAM-dependent methyltransferase [Actinomadura flavalba]|uniref:SAM-dependent methyltransferase n=1 Tax=Actinomadura flavalba TaxID=1120938 RepID=UPI000376366E|nr:SAM-dependent methyltransferase [Actinomadura flavalba]